MSDEKFINLIGCSITVFLASILIIGFIVIFTSQQMETKKPIYQRVDPNKMTEQEISRHCDKSEMWAYRGDSNYYSPIYICPKEK